MSSTGTTPKKKGLHPLVWVGIGCTGVAIVGALLVVGASVFVFNKGRELARDIEDNPAPAIAKILAAANPDVEFVVDDPDSGTITFRNITTDEEIVVAYGDLEEGRFSFSNDEGTASFELNSDEDGQSRIVVTDEDGTSTFEAGTAAAADLPGWVPIYDGAEPQGALAANTADGAGGGYTAQTSDSLSVVTQFFLDQLETHGFRIENRTVSSDAAMLSAVSDTPVRQITVILGSRDTETEIVVQYSEKH